MKITHWPKPESREHWHHHIHSTPPISFGDCVRHARRSAHQTKADASLSTLSSAAHHPSMDPPPTASFPTVRVSAADALPRRTPFSPNGRESRTQRTQHYSTTPKTAPNREYFDFIRKGGITLLDLESTPGPADTLASKESGDSRTRKISVEDLSTLGEHDQQEEQGQSQDTPADDLDRIPMSSNIMAFARKSIMQHATTQPRSIFSRLNEKKLQSAKPASLASAQPSPAATNISKSRTTGLEKPTLKSTASSSVSRPKMSPTAFVVATTSSTPPTLTGPALTPVTVPTVPKPSIPGRSVLDFSGASGSGPGKKNPFSFDPSTTKITPPSHIVGSQVQRPVLMAPPSSATDTIMDGIQSENTKEQSLASTEKDPSNRNGFDLRALLRQVEWITGSVGLDYDPCGAISFVNIRLLS